MALQSTTAIATVTLQSASSIVTFSGIPNTYRDLTLVITATTTATAFSNGELRFNADTGNNYSRVQVIGAPPSPGTFNFAGGGENALKSILFGDDLVKSINSFKIMDYSATDKHKTVLMRSSMIAAGEDRVMMAAGRWASTSVVNSITVFPTGASFTAGTSVYLYGVIA